MFFKVNWNRDGFGISGCFFGVVQISCTIGGFILEKVLDQSNIRVSNSILQS